MFPQIVCKLAPVTMISLQGPKCHTSQHTILVYTVGLPPPRETRTRQRRLSARESMPSLRRGRRKAWCVLLEKSIISSSTAIVEGVEIDGSDEQHFPSAINSSPSSSNTGQLLRVPCLLQGVHLPHVCPPRPALHGFSRSLPWLQLLAGPLEQRGKREP